MLGISAGASVGALAALLFMCALWMVDAAAFAGAVGVSMLLYLLARRDLRGGTAAEGGASLLLLTGVILSSACMAHRHPDAVDRARKAACAAWCSG